MSYFLHEAFQAMIQASALLTITSDILYVVAVFNPHPKIRL